SWQVWTIYMILAANFSEEQALKHACLSCDAALLCNCSSMGLDFIPPGLTAKITALNLSHNRIKHIQSKDLQQAVNLRVLLLQSNEISSIDNDSFASLGKLELLDLSNNSLAFLSPVWFGHLVSLQHLRLQGNTYRDLGGSSLFSRLRNLSSLHLGNPGFSTIRQGSFEGIVVLDKLWIDGGDLGQYEPGSLKVIQKINHMIIQLRNAKVFSAIVRDLLHSVTWLEVRELKLEIEKKSLVQNSTLPFTLQKLTFKDASFTDQYISQLIVLLKEITSLRELEAIDCGLEGRGEWDTKAIASSGKSFVETVSIVNVMIQNFHLFIDLEGMESQINKVKRLTIASSRVFMVPCNLARNFSSLWYLDFHDNLLVNNRLNETICEAAWPSLQILNLSRNSLKSLEETAKYVTRLHKLIYLDISQNKFAEIPDVCEWPKNLKHLNLSSTQMSKVTTCIPTTLEVLDVSANNLREFGLQLPFLKELYLAKNQLKTLPGAAPIPNLVAMSVRRNKLNGFSREEFEGTQVAAVHLSLLECHRTLVVVLTCALLLLLILIVVAVGYKFHAWIVDNIIDSIEKSRKTLFVLSEHFVQSEWCKYELDFSHFRLFDENNDAAILILLEPIQSEAIPKRFCKLRKIMNTKTYLEWPPAEERQAMFWENLKGALRS
ncbi:TLR21 protein, partial [Centropus bengalensis]|nr:TLR21 protein [Centropus bengalensis]